MALILAAAAQMVRSGFLAALALMVSNERADPVAHASEVAQATQQGELPDFTPLSHTLNYVSLRARGSHDLVVGMIPDFYGNLSLVRFHFLIGYDKSTPVGEYQLVEIDGFSTAEEQRGPPGSTREYITEVEDAECDVQSPFLFEAGEGLSSAVIVVMQNHEHSTRLVRLALVPPRLEPAQPEPYKFRVTDIQAIEPYQCSYKELLTKIRALAAER